MKRTLKRVKITLIPSLDLIPYAGGIAPGMIEFFFLCFRFNIYYPVKEKKIEQPGYTVGTWYK